MGWYGTYGDFKTVKEYAEKELAYAEGVKVLDRAIYGREVYTLVQGKTGRIITIDIVTRHDGMWGHKPMDESMNPYYYNCPERLLKQSDCMAASAVAWRERCRRQRKVKAAWKAFVASRKEGDTVKTNSSTTAFMYPYKGGFAGRAEDGGVYRYTIDDVPAGEFFKG